MEIIMKPTESCNGTCIYCSAEGAMDKGKVLPADRLPVLFEILAGWLKEQDRRNLRFTWHGGEPLLCGPEYYGTVVTEQRRVFGNEMWRVKNTMQSNLSLVTAKWVPYLRELIGDQAIGTSFDIVDGIRGLAGGRDLAEVWLQALNLLRSSNVRIGVVYVVHRKSLPRAKDLYYYFRNLDAGLNVRFNPLYTEGRAARKELDGLRITAEEYGEFLVDLSDVWLADNMRSRVMPLTEWYRAWRGTFRLCCDSRGTCYETHLGINPDGDVYGCGRASDNGVHVLGNIFEDDLNEILERRSRGELASRSAYLKAGHCRDCRYWELCHGGCPMMAWLYYGDLLRESYFCAARMRLFEHYERLFGPPAHVQSACGAGAPARSAHA